MMKPKYKGKVRDRNGYAVHLFYEYRGHEYMITDGHNGYSETLAEQHKQEQERIDREIEETNKPKEPIHYKETADYGFDLFWESIN